MQPFQFTIRGLMLMTAAIVVGLSIGCLKTAKLDDGLFAFAATWIAIGLVVQIVDLCTALRRATDLSPDERAGWWFAIFWRGALAVLLVGHFLIIALLATGRLTLAGGDESLLSFDPLGHDTLRSAILAMTLLLVLSRLGCSANSVTSRRQTVVINLITFLGIAVLLYYLLLDRFLAYDLVQIACEGIVLGLQHAPAEFERIHSDALALSFFHRAIVAGGLVIWELLCLRLLIVRWKQGSRQRGVLLIMLGVNLALTAIHPIWLGMCGLKEISPFYAEAFPLGPANRWVLGAILTIIFVTAATQRMVAAAPNSVGNSPANGQPHFVSYFHEYRLLAFFLAACTVCMAIRVLVDAAHDSRFPVASMLPGLIRYASWRVLYDPLYQLWLLVFGLAVYRAIFGLKKKSDLLAAAPPELPLSLFAVVWVALLAIVVLAVPTIAALGFGLSLNWWRLPF